MYGTTRSRSPSPFLTSESMSTSTSPPVPVTGSLVATVREKVDRVRVEVASFVPPPVLVGATVVVAMVVVVAIVLVVASLLGHDPVDALGAMATALMYTSAVVAGLLVLRRVITGC